MTGHAWTHDGREIGEHLLGGRERAGADQPEVGMAMGELRQRLAKVLDALHRQPLTHEEQRARLARRTFGQEEPGGHAVKDDLHAIGGRPSRGAPDSPARANSGT